MLQRHTGRVSQTRTSARAIRNRRASNKSEVLASYLPSVVKYRSSDPLTPTRPLSGPQ